ncbi:MAG: arginase [Gaiellaceae bacterium]
MEPAHVSIVGAPLDLGGAARRGVDMGPSAIRYAGLAERLTQIGVDHGDLGNVSVVGREQAAEGDSRARYVDAILDTCDELATRVEQLARDDRIPLVLGGDHSIALGTMVGMAAAYGPGGVLWLDAHGDLNTPETTPSGNVHGMPLAAALGRGSGLVTRPEWRLPAVEPGRVALVGVRSLDAGERELIAELDLAVFTMSDIDRRGLDAVLAEAIAVVQGDGFVHVSLDLDVIDPQAAPGVGTPVAGGLSYREAHLALELVAESASVSSLDVVEVNPILDVANATGRLAVDLVASALGEKIL